MISEIFFGEHLATYGTGKELSICQFYGLLADVCNEVFHHGHVIQHILTQRTRLKRVVCLDHGSQRPGSSGMNGRDRQYFFSIPCLVCFELLIPSLSSISILRSDEKFIVEILGFFDNGRLRLSGL